ncbi:hypothetical protein OGH69_13010 [Flavobacterium sp. MFBS3-15]|uniref:hypothetical protein n=1 Tax=Flavobacterium sp. MFBS3-15 TaxID=2989816 RepID=UPI00223655E7|nr:hypothetical protein [Flavobacterium sp. MFBS3-15]MCW4469893.1 hypothetical protein [Flavobacterium sp. MFBS3-15]
MKKRLLLIMAFVAVMISCSKDDGDGNNGENPIGGEIFTAQVVKIQIPEGTELTQTMYDGEIGGIPVKLVKAPGNMLAFYLPTNMPTGNAALVIPALSNMTIDYNIQQSVLNASANEIISGYINSLDLYAQNFGDSPQAQSLRHNIENLETIYNALSDEEKNEMALTYQVNKMAFDGVLAISMERTSDHEASRAVLKVGLAAAAIVEGVALVAATVASATTVAALAPAALGAVTVYAGLVLINNTVSDIFEVNVIKENLNLGGLWGVTDRTEMPRFIHNVSQNITLQANQRELAQSDSSRTDEYTSEFFENFSHFNNYVGITNNSIGIINNELESADLHAFSAATLSADTTFSMANIDEEAFGDITFSLSHPNLVLEEASLLADGQLKVKIKVIGIPPSREIETNLNYTFDNGFSSFTGRFPIIVEIPLEGSWNAINIGGVAIGEWINVYSPSCPNVVILQDKWLNRTLQFTENTFNFSGNVVTKNLNVVVQSDCTISMDSEDTEQQDFDEEGGTYTVEGNILTLFSPEDGDQVSVPVQFITADKIQIADEIYERQ